MRHWRAEREKAELREQLREQLNVILETRETARGLIVNLSDVLFDFNKATLRPGAREKLAKIAGIIQSHPGLEMEAEGHADSIGTDKLQPAVVRTAGGIRPCVPHRAGYCSRDRRHRRIRRKPSRGHERNAGRATAESSRRTGRVGRADRNERAGRDPSTGEIVTRHTPFTRRRATSSREGNRRPRYTGSPGNLKPNRFVSSGMLAASTSRP